MLVKETIAQKAGSLVDTTQTNVYVMDRTTLENLADDRAYAFDPENVVDRAGAYRLNLPFDTSRDETYPIYKNEIDATYQMRPNTADPTTDEEGLKLANFVAAVDEAPLSEAYLAELRKTVPLPEAMTLDQLKPQLQQYGLNVDALLAALAPSLTAADFAALGELAAQPDSAPLRDLVRGSVRRSSRPRAPRSTSASPNGSGPGPSSLPCPSYRRCSAATRTCRKRSGYRGARRDGRGAGAIAVRVPL